MTSLESCYLPADRLRSLATGTSLPSFVTGSALFADIAGFTTLTEQLTQALGPRRGAETLTGHLNAVYSALIREVERYGGVVVSFSGDAITCWFDGDESSNRASVTAFALLDAVDAYENVALSDGETTMLGLKVAIASGMARRFVVGDPAVQQFDTLAGVTIARMDAAENVANRGDVIADLPTVERLGSAAYVREWRTADGHRLAVLDRPDLSVDTVEPPTVDLSSLTGDQLSSWLLPAVARQLQSGLGEFLTELRPAVALFLRFSGVDYDHDPDAEAKLNRLIQQVQSVVASYDGSVVSLTIGDKGSYLETVFGAPVAHEDDTQRALKAALDVRDVVNNLGYLEPAQIGISQGIMRTGAYGSETRRTYGVFGDDVNLAARLMVSAQPGTILVSEAVARSAEHMVHFESQAPLRVKGKLEPVPVLRLLGPAEIAFADRFYTTPLTGRETELEQVLRALQPLREGRHAGVIIIHGSPGMGKSRLAYETQRRFQIGGPAVWLTGLADERVRSPLQAVSQAVRAYFGQSTERPADENALQFEATFDHLLESMPEAEQHQALQQGRTFLARMVGSHAVNTASTTANDIDEKTHLDKTIAALKEFARAAARRQPVVLHLEDAQWLDGSSLRVVQELTFAMQDVPLAIVLTSRDADDGQRFALDDVYEVMVTHINLDAWTDASVRAVAEALLDGRITDKVVTYLRDRAEGNPFFTEQLLLDLRERQAVDWTPEGWTLDAEAVADVPPTLNAVLIARLDRLPAEVRAVVQRAAILGREVDTAVLARLLQPEEFRYIQSAEEAGVWSRIAGMRYLFRHVLLRDAAYEMQIEVRRSALHRLAAEAIEALYPEDPIQDDVLLAHWHAAGETGRALMYLDRVVRRLIEIEGQYALAQHLLERSLSRLSGADPGRVMALNWMSKGAWRRGLYAEASAAAQAARVLAETLDDHAGLATSLHSLGVVAERQGMYEDARACFEQSRILNEALDDRTGLAASLNSLGIVATAQGMHQRAREFLESSLALRRSLGDQRGMSACYTNLAVVAWNQGALDEARTFVEQSLALDRELQDRAGIATSLSNLGAIVTDQGFYELARAYNEESLQLFRELGDRDGIAFCLNNLGSLLAESGAVDEARAYLDQSLRMSRELGDPVRIANSLEHLGKLSYRQARYGEAHGWFQDALRVRQEIGSTDRHLSLHWLARTNIQQGDLAAARTRLRENLEALADLDLEVGHKLAALLVASELHLAEGRVQAAAEAAHHVRFHPTSTPQQRQDAERIVNTSQIQAGSKAMPLPADPVSADIDTLIADLLNVFG